VHLLAIEVGGQRRLLAAGDLGKPLRRAAQEYLRQIGKSKLSWLDPGNEVSGYSRVSD
jgi:hypothetical protein